MLDVYENQVQALVRRAEAPVLGLLGALLPPEACDRSGATRHPSFAFLRKAPKTEKYSCVRSACRRCNRVGHLLNLGAT
jgi:hypothetical protein